MRTTARRLARQEEDRAGSKRAPEATVVPSPFNQKGHPAPRIMNRQPVTLAHLVEGLNVHTVRGRTDHEIQGLAMDSRQVRPGFVFVAVTGSKADGHHFLGEAVRKGAVAVVSERPPEIAEITWIQTPDARRGAGILSAKLAGHPSRSLELVGVTGTNGKTTTAYLLDAVFTRLAPPSAMMGTVVQRIGEESWPAPFTTPESPEVQSFLARAVEAGCRYGALEVSSHGLALGRVEGTEFASAVFTNLSRDHLDFHRDMEDYFAAKRALFDRHLRPGAAAVVGVDEGFGRRLVESLARPVRTFGFSEDADLRIENIDAGYDGIRIRFRDAGRERLLRSPLIGRPNALNLLAAFGASCALGLDPESVLEALGESRGAPGRYEVVDAGQPFHVIVDYAHTDDALRNLLETTRALPHRRILTVFGCGGDRDTSKRPLMGAVTARLSDVVVITSDNPRSEDPHAIIREIELGTKGPQTKAEVRIEPDRRKAIELALSLAGAGDVVLVSGKGHEPYQIIRGKVVPFDDRQVVREILTAGSAESPQR